MIVYLSSSGKGRSSFLLGVDPVHHHNQDDDDGDDFDRALRLSRLLLTILVFEMLLLPGPLQPPMGGKMQYLDIGS